jgi:hypothetical protein
MVLSQILWFYRTGESDKKPILSSFLILNGLIFLFCMPWLLFLALNYKGQPLLGTHSILDRLIPLFHMPLLIFMSLGSKGQSMDVYPIQKPDSFWNIFYGVISDWTVHIPLMIASIILLIFFPLVSKNKKNGFLLFSVFVLPIGGVYLFCKLFNVTHFVSSKYFINFLPLFFILLYLSLNAIDLKFQRLRGFARLKFFFVIFFIASNFAILPSYYRSEKRDYRGLVTYLKMHLQEGDRIIAGNRMDIQLMLHYFGVYPKDRYYVIPAWKVSEDEFENRIVLAYRDIKFTIICSKSHWFKYLTDGGRLWILSDKGNSRIIKEKLSCVLKGYFDGSFFNMNRFPTDASIYLFLWDPSSPGEKGIDMPIE